MRNNTHLTKVVPVRFSEAQYAQLEKQAKAERTTVTNHIRAAVVLQCGLPYCDETRGRKPA